MGMCLLTVPAKIDNGRVLLKIVAVSMIHIALNRYIAVTVYTRVEASFK